jgi:hypothetical protein
MTDQCHINIWKISWTKNVVFMMSFISSWVCRLAQTLKLSENPPFGVTLTLWVKAHPKIPATRQHQMTHQLPITHQLPMFQVLHRHWVTQLRVTRHSAQIWVPRPMKRLTHLLPSLQIPAVPVAQRGNTCPRVSLLHYSSYLTTLPHPLVFNR